jgi:hypothetical protein
VNQERNWNTLRTRLCVRHTIPTRTRHANKQSHHCTPCILQVTQTTTTHPIVFSTCTTETFGLDEQDDSIHKRTLHLIESIVTQSSIYIAIHKRVIHARRLSLERNVHSIQQRPPIILLTPLNTASTYNSILSSHLPSPSTSLITFHSATVAPPSTPFPN